LQGRKYLVEERHRERMSMKRKWGKERISIYSCGRGRQARKMKALLLHSSER
jgi:hypothetical protein